MSASERMVRVYDRTMRGKYQRRYYSDSGYYNFGYWDSGAKSQAEACDALVDQLVSRIASNGGRILDVACGLGASTHRLTQTYPAEMITAVNISEAQIADARLRAPGCNFHVMNATSLDFPDNHFDAVICVEAAFHFDTRERFLKEARRVLKPGGSLVLSDILFRHISDRLSRTFQIPLANLVPNIDVYREGFATAGFGTVEVTDATASCLGGFCRHLSAWPHAERRAGRMNWLQSLAGALICKPLAAFFGFTCKTYLVVSARKAV